MHLAETELCSILTAKGFEIVDHNQISRIQKQNQERQALTGNIEAMKSLGLDFGAQYMIVGTAVVQDAGEVIAIMAYSPLPFNLQQNRWKYDLGLFFQFSFELIMMKHLNI